MPFYDRACPFCDTTIIDSWEPVTAPQIPCPKCYAHTQRAWLSKPPSVIPDDIPGGVEIRHGLCNEDGSPKRYYSKSDIAAAAKAKGWTNYVEHIGKPGSDRNDHTSRWV